MFKKLKSFLKWSNPHVLPIFAGAIQVLSFAPFNIATAGLLSIALFLYVLHGHTAKQGFFRGFYYGLGLFGVGASWIYVSVYTYGGESMPVSLFITIGFVCILSLFTGAVGMVVNKWWASPGVRRTVFAFPAVWVLVEILRGWVFTGFPWLYLGYSQGSSPIRAYATIGSVWLVSIVVAMIAGLFYEIYRYVANDTSNRKYLAKLVIGCAVLWVGAVQLNFTQWTFPHQRLSTAIIQGNIPQQLRWDNEHLNQIVTTYSTLTAEHLDVDLIIWPESAIPVPLPSSQGFFEDMNRLAASQTTGFIAGVPVQVKDQNRFYNGMISLGQGSGLYYKKHLVPFGEYVPLEKVLRGMIEFFNMPMSDFVVGPEMPPLQTLSYKVAPAICYEIAYPFTIRHATQQADFIVTISNDAWFGQSLGPKQHLQIAQMRALETGRFVLRSTNSGITAIIDAKGRVHKQIPAADFTRPTEGSVLVGEFTVMEGKTPWVKFGPWLLLGVITVLLSLSFWPKKKKKR